MLANEQCYAAWLRSHGVVFFRVLEERIEEVRVEFLLLQWASDNTAQHYRMLFNDPRELRNAAMMSSTWWPHVEEIVVAEAPATTLRYDQLGWWTNQPWMQEKLSKSSS
jgi:hypothetical protein